MFGCGPERDRILDLHIVNVSAEVIFGYNIGWSPDAIAVGAKGGPSSQI